MIEIVPLAFAMVGAHVECDRWRRWYSAYATHVSIQQKDEKAADYEYDFNQHSGSRNLGVASM